MNFHEFLQVEGIQVEKKKNEHVFRQGDLDRNLYFIQSGLLKAYYISDEGKEFVKSFLLPDKFIGSLTSAYAQGECSFSLVCLEPTVLRKIPFELLSDHVKDNPLLAIDMIELLLGFAMKKEKREYEFLCLSAEKRYLDIAENYPLILEKVTQNDLARYLGITPVGLSRIKKRVQNK